MPGPHPPGPGRPVDLSMSGPPVDLSMSGRPVDLSMSGCTACVLVARDAHVTVANVGDSRAALFRASPASAAGAGGKQGGAVSLSAWPLTVDHKPVLPGETRRILLAGGRLAALSYEDGSEGPVRVWLPSLDLPGLAMSRSLGDTLARRAGVIGAPDLYTLTLAPADAFLVLASDGLWEFTSPAEVAATLAATHALAQRTLAGRPPSAEPPASHLALALDALAELAGARWREREGAVDDISILIAEVGSLT